MLLQLSHFFLPFIPLCLAPTFPPAFPHLSSCPWVIHITSLATTFPILYLHSPCLFSAYHLCYLFSVPVPPLSPSQSPVDNSPCDLHFCGYVPVLVVCLLSADFSRDPTGKKGLARSIQSHERQGPTSKITVSSKAIIQNGRTDKVLLR